MENITVDRCTKYILKLDPRFKIALISWCNQVQSRSGRGRESQTDSLSFCVYRKHRFIAFIEQIHIQSVSRVPTYLITKRRSCSCLTVQAANDVFTPAVLPEHFTSFCKSVTVHRKNLCLTEQER